MHWPDGFMWGTGASATQCEGAARSSDWWDWERAGRAPLSGDGNGFALDGLNWRAGLELFRDGVLRIPGLEAVERPDLAGSFDLIGFSFYSTIGIRQGRVVPYPADAPVSPLGYGIWADGLGLVLDRLHRMVPGTPLLVAEYGIGTGDDTERVAYLERGLQVTNDAIARGAAVRGFFHWTAVDNYEWLHGFAVQFGIIGRDRNVRPSALVLRREAMA
jgi:beta-glucosidase